MKIALCMPVHSSLTKRFALSAFNILIDALTNGVERDGERTIPEIRPFMASSADTGFNRNVLTRDALAWGADFLLFADVDHHIPANGLARLLALGKEVVGLNFRRRGEGDALPTVARRIGEDIYEPVWTNAEKARTGLVEQVDAMGFGFCLVAAGVFAKLEALALAEGRPSVWPIFYFAPIEGALHSLSEDSAFCRQCASAGIPIFVDHRLSFESAHMTEIPLMFDPGPPAGGIVSTRVSGR
jgi:hypothetical protein